VSQAWRTIDHMTIDVAVHQEALPVCAVLDGLADLLDAAAAAQAAHSTGADDWGARADKAAELAHEVRALRAELVPAAINPNYGDATPGDGYGVVSDWRRMLNRALTHAQLGLID